MTRLTGDDTAAATPAANRSAGAQALGRVIARLQDGTVGVVAGGLGEWGTQKVKELTPMAAGECPSSCTRMPANCSALNLPPAHGLPPTSAVQNVPTGHVVNAQGFTPGFRRSAGEGGVAEEWPLLHCGRAVWQESPANGSLHSGPAPC